MSMGAIIVVTLAIKNRIRFCIRLIKKGKLINEFTFLVFIAFEALNKDL